MKINLIHLMKTAIVIGATGLVGSHLVELLLKDTRIDKIKIFTRRSTNIFNGKIEERIVNFDEPDKWKKYVTGDIFYSAMGTTLKAAGSKDMQYSIDYTCQYQVAKIAALNNVPEYILVSAAGANPGAKIFYSRMKGLLEQDVKKLPFETIHIIRPGMLAGDRKEKRNGEKAGIGVLNMLSAIPGLGHLKPIQAREVAYAMINASFRHVVGIHIYTLGEVFKLARLQEAVSMAKVDL
jgi:uncharacterized protein YbjT (DUF2867 family)